MDRQNKIQELAWNRRARDLRSDLAGKLSPLGEFSFLSESETSAFGTRFWSEIQRRGASHDTPASALAELGNRLRSDEVVWLHRQANDAGAIRTQANRLIPNLPQLLEEFGPDTLFATADLRAGFALDVGEHDQQLTWWCG